MLPRAQPARPPTISSLSINEIEQVMVFLPLPDVASLASCSRLLDAASRRILGYLRPMRHRLHDFSEGVLTDTTPPGEEIADLSPEALDSVMRQYIKVVYGGRGISVERRQAIIGRFESGLAKHTENPLLACLHAMLHQLPPSKRWRRTNKSDLPALCLAAVRANNFGVLLTAEFGRSDSCGTHPCYSPLPAGFYLRALTQRPVKSERMALHLLTRWLSANHGRRVSSEDVEAVLMAVGRHMRLLRLVRAIGPPQAGSNLRQVSFRPEEMWGYYKNPASIKLAPAVRIDPPLAAVVYRAMVAAGYLDEAARLAPHFHFTMSVVLETISAGFATAVDELKVLQLENRPGLPAARQLCSLITDGLCGLARHTPAAVPRMLHALHTAVPYMSVRWNDSGAAVAGEAAVDATMAADAVAAGEAAVDANTAAADAAEDANAAAADADAANALPPLNLRVLPPPGVRTHVAYAQAYHQRGMSARAMQPTYTSTTFTYHADRNLPLDQHVADASAPSPWYTILGEIESVIALICAAIDSTAGEDEVFYAVHWLVQAAPIRDGVRTSIVPTPIMRFLAYAAADRQLFRVANELLTFGTEAMPRTARRWPSTSLSHLKRFEYGAISVAHELMVIYRQSVADPAAAAAIASAAAAEQIYFARFARKNPRALDWMVTHARDDVLAALRAPGTVDLLCVGGHDMVRRVRHAAIAVGEPALADACAAEIVVRATACGNLELYAGVPGYDVLVAALNSERPPRDELFIHHLRRFMATATPQEILGIHAHASTAIMVHLQGGRIVIASTLYWAAASSEWASQLAAWRTRTPVAADELGEWEEPPTASSELAGWVARLPRNRKLRMLWEPRTVDLNMLAMFSELSCLQRQNAQVESAYAQLAATT